MKFLESILLSVAVTAVVSCGPTSSINQIQSSSPSSSNFGEDDQDPLGLVGLGVRYCRFDYIFVKKDAGGSYKTVSEGSSTDDLKRKGFGRGCLSYCLTTINDLSKANASSGNEVLMKACHFSKHGMAATQSQPAAPRTETAAPRTETAAPRTETAEPRTETAAPRTETAAPPAQPVAAPAAGAGVLTVSNIVLPPAIKSNEEVAVSVSINNSGAPVQGFYASVRVRAVFFGTPIERSIDLESNEMIPSGASTKSMKLVMPAVPSVKANVCVRAYKDKSKQVSISGDVCKEVKLN